MKLITFTVPSYNSAGYMHKCIDSLLKGGDEVEILIVDDGSRDETGAIADRYQAEYPGICRAIHQENGGHGEGINQGLRYATGRYFKVVDSDDWVNEAALRRVLDTIRDWTDEEADLIVCNYVYEYADGSPTKTICYKNVFPDGKIVRWEETKRFSPSQYLTLHSAIYRTEILRRCGRVLPKHIFYEDNLFVYDPLPLTEKVCYLNADFYRYLIGREGQSVAEATMVKRWSHQMLVTKEIFAAHDLKKLQAQNPRLARYMYQELELMVTIASIFTRMNRTDEAEAEVRKMWAEMRAQNPRLARRLRYASLATFVNFPGKAGRSVSIFFYHFAHKIVAFN
jgi:glycosyltransferase involved in cell wall biosynthesis